jgi:subtilisin family serine protease
VLVVSICGALAASAPALAQEGRAGDVIPGKYIVVAEDGRDPAAVARWQNARDREVLPLVNGFAATLDAAQVRALRASARVAYVEPDRVVTIAATQNMDANGDPWGLDRVDQTALPLSRTYTYTRNGAGVTAYVIDTGLQANHPDFGGRAANVYDALGGNGNDCHGHGTQTCRSAAGGRPRSTTRRTTSPTRASSSPWRPATRTRPRATSPPPRRRRPTPRPRLTGRT